MNIKKAKQQIKNAVQAYFAKDELGNYYIPIERQRPIFLFGPPGIGKTAIMEQIAQEMDVALLSYSMTHHTRQSALGLPFIARREYGGTEYAISEYTMSEIIASMYDLMKATGKKEGILFLDEINCVSETLAPVMLQFLQYKVFGMHKIPPGWIVVTAGNPPEFNNSVRDFDIVTWDRLKRVDIEPDYDCWKEYAIQTGVHASILSYLEIKKNHFYKVETTVAGKSFVTARGWDDLSQMVRLYERLGITADEDLMIQYLQNRQIAKDFAIYYILFQKYRSDYQIDQILAGTAPDEITQRAQEARFDERLSIIGLLLDALRTELGVVMRLEERIFEYHGILKAYQADLKMAGSDAAAALEKQLILLEEQLTTGKRSGSMSFEKQKQSQLLAERLRKLLLKLRGSAAGTDAFALAREDFEAMREDLKEAVREAGSHLSNAFIFCENAFGDGQEMLVFVSELTVCTDAAKYISRYGCKEYFAHNKELLLYERQQSLIHETDEIQL